MSDFVVVEVSTDYMLGCHVNQVSPKQLALNHQRVEGSEVSVKLR